MTLVMSTSMLPDMQDCQLCGEPADFDVVELATGEVHRECMVRMALGGIGHLENHQLWCVERGDPDGGRTYRQSALEVYEWIKTHRV